MADDPWAQLSLWEQERLTGEVWLNTQAWGYEWELRQYDGLRWSVLDGGLARTAPAAVRQLQRAFGELGG